MAGQFLVSGVIGKVMAVIEEFAEETCRLDSPQTLFVSGAGTPSSS